MKCQELSNLIKERLTSNTARSVFNQYKPIVENIFGFEDSFSQDLLSQPRNGGWQLKTLTRSTNPTEYECVISFLHPEGIFFTLIRSLMAETSAKFEFPVSRFPPYFRSMIENGTAPPFFANKIISTSYASASHLILNPFEFYIFHFGIYILNTNGFCYETPVTPNDEPAYFTLLRIYLDYFVPSDNLANSGNNMVTGSASQQSSLWQSLSSTTTSILNLASSNTQQSNNLNASTGNLAPSSLFKASIFHPQTPFNQNINFNYLPTPGPLLYGQGEHIKSPEWRCSTFLLMLTELWFGNIPAPKTNYILRSTNLDDLSLKNLQPYSANVDQMVSVRIVIKHLHYFSNSFTYNPVGHAVSQGLAEIKQAIWTSKYPLQKRLYTFIKVAFNRWPMDYTFRQPLEAWLSYIQPWRYVKRSTDATSEYEDFEGNRGATIIDAPFIENQWKNFISDNLLYYTVIFSLLVDRLLQLDLSSSRNSLMLFRVVKVYSQPGFLSLLREAEEAVIRNNLEQNMNKSHYRSSSNVSRGPNNLDTLSSPSAKLLAPSFLASGKVSTPKTRIGALEHHLMNLESDTEFNYVSLFAPQMKQKLTKLLAAIQESRLSIKEFVKSVEVRSKLRNKGWLDSIRSFLTMEDACFESKDEREMYKDKLLAEDYLNFVTCKISQCFEVQVPEIDLFSRSTNVSSNVNQPNRIFFNV